MAMALSGVDEWQIKLHGRWKSNAFMDYIRPQAAIFASHMAQNMIQTSTRLFVTTEAQQPTYTAAAVRRRRRYHRHY